MEEKKEKQPLSTETYKGVRDFYPEDLFIQKYIFAVLRQEAESFGYVEYSASILEPAELYRSKTSEEIVNEQTYTFKDRGDREVTLRPEMTPTVARMVAARRHDLSVPIRWYSIPNLFRYERPQRGRLREHWQLNCDIFGVAGYAAEVEIIALAHKILRSFGIQQQQFEIRINNRAALTAKLQAQLTDPSHLKTALRLLDRKEKMDEETFTKEWAAVSPTPFSPSQEPDEETQRVLTALQKLGIENARYHPTLTRGFDYYTGTVFEVFDTHESNRRSLFGGGRYDNLLSLFGGQSIPAVGFGMGDVTIKDVLETYGLLPTYKNTTSLALLSAPHTPIEQILLLADRLRSSGVRVAVDSTERKLGDQIKAADKQHIPFVMVVGETELKEGMYTVKKMLTGEETKVPEAGIASLVQP